MPPGSLRRFPAGKERMGRIAPSEYREVGGMDAMVSHRILYALSPFRLRLAVPFRFVRRQVICHTLFPESLAILPGRNPRARLLLLLTSPVYRFSPTVPFTKTGPHERTGRRQTVVRVCSRRHPRPCPRRMSREGSFLVIAGSSRLQDHTTRSIRLHSGGSKTYLGSRPEVAKRVLACSRFGGQLPDETRVRCATAEGNQPAR